MKILNKGRMIEGLPSRRVLTDESAPGAVADALAAYDEAREALKGPEAALRAAEKRAQEEVILVRGERARYDAELQERTRNEAGAVLAAERSLSAAARGLVAAIEDNSDALREIAARQTLRAHADEVEALLDAREARARRVGPSVPDHPARDRVMEARQASGTVRRDPLETLDLVNVRALVEVAGGDPVGFVAVRSARDGMRVETTPRRAAALVKGGGHGRRDWSLVDEEVPA